MKAGLEVHQQLATGKLFCDCPAELSDDVTATAVRELRATGGENHLVDAAAAFQAARGLRYRYEAVRTSCLVELDEEPPHALNPDAVDVALTLARLLHARPLDEIEVMRKIVVDGSNTSGFQRTALVAADGYLEVSGRRHAILSICLEEDAARKIGEGSGEVTYRLDRLGIPLIEIATGPDIVTPADGREVAEEIGGLLRSTGRVRRGIGTIREDLNVSADGGTRVEIKGVQELRLIPRYLEIEESRQRALLRVRARLRDQGARAPDRPPVDARSVLHALTGPPGDLVRRGGVALALHLPGFHGCLRSLEGSEERLGRELADYARATGLKGILHSDELPGFGLTDADVASLRSLLGAGPLDAFVIAVAPDAAAADRAIRAVTLRATGALDGVPAETRDPLPDGRTRYSRPLPGRDRMYPETDVPPVPVTADRLARIEAGLPERPEAARERLTLQLGLDAERARTLVRAGEVGRLDRLVAQGHAPALVARLLVQELPEAQSTLPPEGPVIDLDEDVLGATLAAVESGTIAKEGIGPVLQRLLTGTSNVAAAVADAGLGGGDRGDLDRLVAQVVAANGDLIARRGAGAFAGLMGDVMKEARGRWDGKVISDRLRAAIERAGGQAGATA